MSPSEKKSSQRELPISLQAIETILRYLNEKKKDELVSMRNISRNTDLSMRVVKNVLLQLKSFNQVETIVEENQILPKWKITDFGRRVIQEADGAKKDEKLEEGNYLLSGIIIPENVDLLRENLKISQEDIISELNSLQINLSRILGPIFNINEPLLEDIISFSIKRVNFLKQTMSNLSLDPVSHFKLKASNKNKKISEKQTSFVYIEVYFINSVILNQIKHLNQLIKKLTQFIENDAFSSALSFSKQFREELRILSRLINQRNKVGVNSHILKEDELTLLSKNEIKASFLENIINLSKKKEQEEKIIQDLILEFLAKIEKDQPQLKDHNYEIKDNVPLYLMYQLILDEHPEVDISIERFEKIINKLSKEGYIPGIKTIKQNGDIFKIVQMKPYELSDDEITLIFNAYKLQKFNLDEIVSQVNWSIERVKQILRNLTDLGILNHSKSPLYGDQWYLVSEA
jgi:hypothetical protein